MVARELTAGSAGPIQAIILPPRCLKPDRLGEFIKPQSTTACGQSAVLPLMLASMSSMSWAMKWSVCSGMVRASGGVLHSVAACGALRVSLVAVLPGAS